MKLGSIGVVAALGLLLSLAPSQAGWGHGCGGGWGGGWHGGGCYYGGGWGGWRGGYGPGWGWGPAFGVTVVAPPPPVYYRTVYVEQPKSYTLPHSVLASAQIQLAKLGYYRGEIDGDFGPQTSRAFRNFQIDNGLPVTGMPDGRTLSRLGV